MRGFTPTPERADSFLGTSSRDGNSEVAARLVWGFTILEMVVYVAVLSILIGAVCAFLLWAVRIQHKTEALGEVNSSASQALHQMVQEAREADGVYIPTSVFGSHPGQLSLRTSKYIPPDEEYTYIDFFVCGDQLCLKKEEQSPIALTSELVEVQNFQVSQVGDSVRITLRLAAKTSSPRPEYQAVTELTETASVRIP
ncbi:type II secretion system GspH family protein [Patescibacteria group bacterium]|nr:type II secretion system GspH family protein [Patescibacteria group bacterium]